MPSPCDACKDTCDSGKGNCGKDCKCGDNCKCSKGHQDKDCCAPKAAAE